MSDRDLAALYDVETPALNQAVRRHIDRFPPDFMFQLTTGEIEDWKSQIVISNRERMGVRKPPLWGRDAIERADQRTRRSSQHCDHAGVRPARQMILTHVKLAQPVEGLEARYDEQFTVVFDAIPKLMAPPFEEPTV